MEKCLCKSAPIPGPCVKPCLRRMLLSSTIEELQLILGLAPDLADEIFNVVNSGYKIASFEDFNLDFGQSDLLIKKFKSISQYQLDYFNKDKNDRVEANEA